MAVERLTLVLVAAGCVGDDYNYRYCANRSVVINEVLAAAVSDHLGHDFVEIFNGSDDAVLLEDWALSRRENQAEYVIPASYVDTNGKERTPTVLPGQWLAIAALPYIPADGSLATGFDLNRDGDGLWLYADNSALCDAVAYPDQHAGFSWGRPFPDGRQPDGTDEWCVLQDMTEGQANGACLDPDGGLP